MLTVGARVIDVLFDGPDCLILVEDRLYQLGEVGAELVRHCQQQPRTVEELATELIATLGAPPSDDPVTLIGQVTAKLVELGVLDTNVGLVP